MALLKEALFICLFFVLKSNGDDGVLCQPGFCRTFGFEVGCTAMAQHCNINNATHSGLRLPSPSICNCCNFCMPFFLEGEYCSQGGPGTGTTVGRCGYGLNCTSNDEHSYCERMKSICHSDQDDYDGRYHRGEVGVLEFRRHCDGKGLYAHFDCVPTQSCFCQSEEGERIFGEVLDTGEVARQNMHCGCSRIHDKIRKNIRPGVPYPVVAPRCTSDGGFNPVQCLNRTCFCVDKITGAISGSDSIHLDENPITELPCYEAELDLFPSQSISQNGLNITQRYNHTTPCLENIGRRIEIIEQSIEDGFILDFFSTVPGCLPDGTLGRMAVRNGTQICIDERNEPIGEYKALRNTEEFQKMDCKCAQTELLMINSIERPICCKNGNFRTIQCRRGLCRCVDSDGRQYGLENADVTQLRCFTEGWREC